MQVQRSTVIPLRHLSNYYYQNFLHFASSIVYKLRCCSGDNDDNDDDNDNNDDDDNDYDNDDDNDDDVCYQSEREYHDERRHYVKMQLVNSHDRCCEVDNRCAALDSVLSVLVDSRVMTDKLRQVTLRTYSADLHALLQRITQGR